MLIGVISFIVAAALMAFGYRWLRNGVFDQQLPSWLAGNTFSRICWALTCVGGFALITQDVRWVALLFVFVAQQFSIRVTHGYIMDAGRWPVPEKKWPSFFLPQLTQAQWDGMTITQRAAWDGVQGACVGLVRGVIAFAPLAFFGYSPLGLVAPIVALGIGTPFAYFLGYLIPFEFYGVHKNSAEWGEVLHGIVWAVAFAVIG